MLFVWNYEYKIVKEITNYYYKHGVMTFE